MSDDLETAVAPKKAAPKKSVKKAAPKKASPKKAATVKKDSKAAPKKASKSSLPGNATKVLETLAKNSKPLTRNQLSEKTGIKGGWSKMLGASTKGAGKETLEGLGYVKSERHEGESSIVYSITAAGRKAIGK